MARTSNNGGEGKSTKVPAKTPARRRTDKTRQAAAATANDSMATTSAVSKTTAAALAMSSVESTETLNPAEVARRAFELYVRRGCCDGYDKEDWFEAERQLKQQH